jgi:hypothetical protein
MYTVLTMHPTLTTGKDLKSFTLRCRHCFHLATAVEWYVNRWLEKHGYKSLEESTYGRALTRVATLQGMIDASSVASAELGRKLLAKMTAQANQSVAQIKRSRAATTQSAPSMVDAGLEKPDINAVEWIKCCMHAGKLLVPQVQ